MSLKLHLRTGERLWRDFFAAGAFFCYRERNWRIDSNVSSERRENEKDGVSESLRRFFFTARLV